MAFTVFSASSTPTSFPSGSVRSAAKNLVEALDLVGSSSDTPPMDTAPPANQQVPAVTPDDEAGGMAYDNYLNMLAAQRAFAETEFFGVTDQSLLIGGAAVRSML